MGCGTLLHVSMVINMGQSGSPAHRPIEAVAPTVPVALAGHSNQPGTRPRPKPAANEGAAKPTAAKPATQRPTVQLHSAAPRPERQRNAAGLSLPRESPEVPRRMPSKPKPKPMQAQNAHTRSAVRWRRHAPGVDILSVLPPIQQVPSPDWPFILFHLRKTGGSAFRPRLAQAADELNLTFFVPCLEKRDRNSVNKIGLPRGDHMASCHQYHLGSLVGRRLNRISVFAGHFFWDASALQSPSVMVPGTAPFSCFIMVREPVSRFQSCYTERFQKTIGLPLNKLSMRVLNGVLTNYSEKGSAMPQGCNNEIARWISPDTAWGDAHANRGELSLEAIDETKRRLSLCTIGDVSARADDTLRVIRHWHPWLATYYRAEAYIPGHYTHVNSGHTSKLAHYPREALPSATIAAIRQANTLDLNLYSFAMARFELLLGHIDRTMRYA